MSEVIWETLMDKVRGGLLVRTHSGQVRPGEVFLALSGSRVDGSAFIAEAIDRKAGYVIAPAGYGVGAEGRKVDATMILEHADPRGLLGELAAMHHGTDQSCPLLVGVTGTNGKTTVVALIAHLLSVFGKKVGIIGTIGAHWPGGSHDLGMTTPDCWRLHRILAEMREAGVTHVCMEVSSHALAQKRTAGLRFEVAVLTNVTQDHLDYHLDMESYFQAKAMLFAPNAGSADSSGISGTRGTSGPRHRVINIDDPYGRRLFNMWGGLGYGFDPVAPEQKKTNLVSEPTAYLRGEILACGRSGLELRTHWESRTWTLRSTLVGRYNAANLLAAQGAGMCLGLKPDHQRVWDSFSGVPGRLERVLNVQGLDIFVDYAHTPDALDNVLGALRDVGFERLIVVFGCGGDRDRSKRPLMGQAVCRHADIVVLTSDNPRHEEPEQILEDVLPGLSGCTMVLREVDRRVAIGRALELMRPGDALLVAGKGHEATQQIGPEYFPFHDPTVIRELLGESLGVLPPEHREVGEFRAQDDTGPSHRERVVCD
ncbi:UDP-N-acetylmuramoyl-L-alanyl-D-glutamate--2,6-diaminopimelate ligase [Desulfonatronum thioautotrophicum]|uniref:UDP-N-acetylmuramoyl-L-alanyl-D-glutamate--2, 6-diaminopimelate ligase n=1 Tax=Desulfonatronum thioautotrophicum TaxID=617001 RepID=UPI0009FDA72B|nr:UDP-N-acetylmuramoyl-L-alanyl-D-glutamate--2,6-diaminopimelate ligase [Desulfonatronum thioautotrophicum]